MPPYMAHIYPSVNGAYYLCVPFPAGIFKGRSTLETLGRAPTFDNAVVKGNKGLLLAKVAKPLLPSSPLSCYTLTKPFVSFSSGKEDPMRAISYSRGRGKLGHNNRSFTSPNVYPENTRNNIVIKQQDLKDAYDEVFGEALEAYNTKQKRKDRKIDSYFRKLFGQDPIDTVLKNDIKQQSFYEYVVGLGTAEDTGLVDWQKEDGTVVKANPEAAARAAMCLKKYMEGFQERNPKFYVFNAVIHMDEKTPHLHYDFIPYADGYKTGMTRQQGMAKALEQMGYGEGRQAVYNFTQTERKFFEEICKKYGFEVKPQEKGRGYTIPTRLYGQYKELKAKVETISKKKAEKQAELDATEEKLDAAKREVNKAVSIKEKIDDEIKRKDMESAEWDAELHLQQKEYAEVEAKKAQAQKEADEASERAEKAKADTVAEEAALKKLAGTEALIVFTREKIEYDKAPDPAFFNTKNKKRQLTDEYVGFLAPTMLAEAERIAESNLKKEYAALEAEKKKWEDVKHRTMHSDTIEAIKEKNAAVKERDDIKEKYEKLNKEHESLKKEIKRMFRGAIDVVKGWFRRTFLKKDDYPRLNGLLRETDTEFAREYLRSLVPKKSDKELSEKDKGVKAAIEEYVRQPVHEAAEIKKKLAATKKRIDEIKEKQKKQDEEEKVLTDLQLIELIHQQTVLENKQIVAFENIDYGDNEKDKDEGYPGKW